MLALVATSLLDEEFWNVAAVFGSPVMAPAVPSRTADGTVRSAPPAQS
jgi:hypothetical protein